MGRVHKLMIKSCLKGILIGWLVLAAIITMNFMSLRSLVFSSSDGPLAVFILMVGFAITFGNAAMGHAVMTMARKKNKDDAV